MKIIDTAECVDRKRLRDEIFPRYADPFLPETFRKVVESFLFYAKGDEFYVKEVGEETHIFAPHGDDISIDLVFEDEGMDFFSYVCPLPELEEDDLEVEPEEDSPLDSTLFLTFDN